MREATRRPAGPRGDALCNVFRQLSQVVPKLHDSFGYTLRVPIVDGQLTYGSLDQPSDEFRAPSMMLRTVRHLFATRCITYSDNYTFLAPTGTCTLCLRHCERQRRTAREKG